MGLRNPTDDDAAAAFAAHDQALREAHEQIRKLEGEMEALLRHHRLDSALNRSAEAAARKAHERAEKAEAERDALRAELNSARAGLAGWEGEALTAQSQRDAAYAEIDALRAEAAERERDDLRARLRAAAEKEGAFVEVPEDGVPRERWLRIGPATARVMLAKSREADDLRARVRELEARERELCQSIIEQIGSTGPESLASAVSRLLVRVRELALVAFAEPEPSGR